jgi:hypothetical protein
LSQLGRLKILAPPKTAAHGHTALLLYVTARQVLNTCPSKNRGTLAHSSTTESAVKFEILAITKTAAHGNTTLLPYVAARQF